MSALVDQLPQWIGAIGGAGGITALIKAGISRRSAKVDATKALQAAAVGLLDPYTEQAEYLRNELAQTREEARALRDDVLTLHQYIATLLGVIEAAGLPIPPRPPRPSSPTYVPDDADPKTPPRPARPRRRTTKEKPDE